MYIHCTLPWHGVVTTYNLRSIMASLTVTTSDEEEEEEEESVSQNISEKMVAGQVTLTASEKSLWSLDWE